MVYLWKFVYFLFLYISLHIQAISKPSSEEYQEKAWSAVCPLVLQLKTFYEFCNELETALTSILTVLCSADMTVMAHLETHQVIM